MVSHTGSLSPLTCRFVVCSVEDMLSLSPSTAQTAEATARTDSVAHLGSSPGRHTRERAVRRLSRGDQSADEISALMRTEAPRSKSAPRARAPAAQHRTQAQALKSEFASFSMQLDRKQSAGQRGRNSWNGRSRSRPRTGSTTGSERSMSDFRPSTPRSRSRQRGGSQASRPAWSTAGPKSPAKLGPMPSGQAPRPSSQRSSAYGRSKSTPRQQRGAKSEDDFSSVYSRRLARRHAALQLEVASVVENAAHHGMLADDLAAKLGQRKLKQREMQLQNKQGATRSLPNGRRFPKSPRRRRPGSNSGASTSSSNYEVWQGQSAVRLEDELRGGKGVQRETDFVVRPWSPKRDGVVWNTLDETAERGSALRPGNDSRARAEYAKREEVLARGKAEMHRIRNMGTRVPRCHGLALRFQWCGN